MPINPEVQLSQAPQQKKLERRERIKLNVTQEDSQTVRQCIILGNSSGCLGSSK